MKRRIEYRKQYRKYDHTDHTVRQIFSDIVLKDLYSHLLIYFAVVVLDVDAHFAETGDGGKAVRFDLVRYFQTFDNCAFPRFSGETGRLGHLIHLFIKATGLQCTLLHRFIECRIVLQPRSCLRDRNAHREQRDKK